MRDTDEEVRSLHLEGARDDFAVRLFQRIDGLVERTILLSGARPPAGRDLDLIVRPPEHRQIVSLLRAERFLPRRRSVHPQRVWTEQWARFLGGGAFPIDLNPADRWGLAPDELDALDADATPLDGMKHVATAAPHHVILMAARAAIRDGKLTDKRRSRIDRALAADPNAWRRARDRASLWGIAVGLSLVEARYRTATPFPRRMLLLARAEMILSGGGVRRQLDVFVRTARNRLPARQAIVSFSGLDGSGKSSQVRAVTETLETLRVPTAVEWMPLGLNPTIRLVRRAAKKVIQRLPRSADVATREGTSLLAGSEPALLRRQNWFIAQAWSTIVAFASAAHYRSVTLRHIGSGKVIIFDRYALDTVAQLRYFYGEQYDFAFQRWIVRSICPTPTCSFLLAVAPETALARKKDHYTLEGLRRQAALLEEEAARLGVQCLDGERDIPSLRAEVAGLVWERLGDR